MSVPRIDEDRIAIARDVMDVFIRKTKKFSDFSPEKQQLIRDFYRFSAIRYETAFPVIGTMIPSTLDVV